MNNQIRDLLSTIYAQSVDIESSRSIGGGCINQTQALTLSNGERVFLKTNDRPPEGLFEKEAPIPKPPTPSTSSNRRGRTSGSCSWD